MSLGARNINTHEERKYIAVPTTTLILQRVSVVDLYVRLGSGRLVRIAHKGSSIDLERLKRFDEKNIEHLFVAQEDLPEVAASLVRGSLSINSIPNLPSEKVLGRFFSIAEAVVAEMLYLPLTEDSLKRTMQLTQEISINMSKTPEFSKIIKIMLDVGKGLARHSLGTVVIARFLAKELSWKSPKALRLLTAGAFLHDIGMRDLPAALHSKNRAEMSAEEIQLYDSHPASGAKILETFTCIPPEVLRIVQEHHELPHGLGTPNQLRSERLLPLAQIVSLASLLAHDIFDQPGGSDPLANVETKTLGLYSNYFNGGLAKVLKKLFSSKVK